MFTSNTLVINRGPVPMHSSPRGAIVYAAPFCHLYQPHPTHQAYHQHQHQHVVPQARPPQSPRLATPRVMAHGVMMVSPRVVGQVAAPTPQHGVADETASLRAEREALRAALCELQARHDALAAQGARDSEARLHEAVAGYKEKVALLTAQLGKMEARTSLEGVAHKIEGANPSNLAAAYEDLLQEVSVRAKAALPGRPNDEPMMAEAEKEWHEISGDKFSKSKMALLLQADVFSCLRDVLDGDLADLAQDGAAGEALAKVMCAARAVQADTSRESQAIREAAAAMFERSFGQLEEWRKAWEGKLEDSLAARKGAVVKAETGRAILQAALKFALLMMRVPGARLEWPQPGDRTSDGEQIIGLCAIPGLTAAPVVLEPTVTYKPPVLIKLQEQEEQSPPTVEEQSPPTVEEQSPPTIEESKVQQQLGEDENLGQPVELVQPGTEDVEALPPPCDERSGTLCL